MDVFKLKMSDRIYVDIKTRDWVQEFRRYGPFINTLLDVETIIELLNQGIDVVIPEKWKLEVFALVSAYNDLAAREKKKTADLAESTLRKQLDKEIKKVNAETDNPYKDDQKVSNDHMVTTPIRLPKSLESQGVGTIKKKITVRTPKAYDLFRASDDAELPITASSSLDDVILENN